MKEQSQQCQLWEEPVEPSADLDKLLDAARMKARRDALCDAVRAVRVAIDARFRLKPMELDLSELPIGLDSGELLEQLNFFLIEFGDRCFRNGVQFAVATQESEKLSEDKDENEEESNDSENSN